jgi:hypothetical protein
MRFDSAAKLTDVVKMIEEHCASPSIVGVTLVLGSRRDAKVDVTSLAEDFRQQITKRTTTIIGEPMNYFTASSMMFFILLVE